MCVAGRAKQSLVEQWSGAVRMCVCVCVCACVCVCVCVCACVCVCVCVLCVCMPVYVFVSAHMVTYCMYNSQISVH